MKYALRIELIKEQRTVELELDEDPTEGIMSSFSFQAPVVLRTNKGTKVIPYTLLEEMYFTIVPFEEETGNDNNEQSDTNALFKKVLECLRKDAELWNQIGNKYKVNTDEGNPS